MSGRKISLMPLMILAAVGLVAMVALDSSRQVETPEVASVDPVDPVEPASPAPPAPRARRPEVAVEPAIEIEPWVEEPYDPPQASESAMALNPDYSWFEGAAGYVRGVEQAQREGKALAVYFYTDWCPYCRELESELLARARVEDYLKYLIKIRVNPEAGPYERAVADRYGVRGYPSFFIQPTTTVAPRKIQRTRGDRLKTPEEFVAALERAARTH